MSDPEEAAVLSIQCEPAAAQVLIDDEAMASDPAMLAQGIALAPGRHRIELRREGYYPHWRELELGAAKSYTLKVSLVRFLE